MVERYKVENIYVFYFFVYKESAFNKICEMLKWKTKLKGKYYYQIDRYYTSSRICSHCDYKEDKLKDLKIREWECEKCGFINERDINTSVNIMFEGLKYCFN